MVAPVKGKRRFGSMKMKLNVASESFIEYANVQISSHWNSCELIFLTPSVRNLLEMMTR